MKDMFNSFDTLERDELDKALKETTVWVVPITVHSAALRKGRSVPFPLEKDDWVTIRTEKNFGVKKLKSDFSSFNRTNNVFFNDYWKAWAFWLHNKDKLTTY